MKKYDIYLSATARYDIESLYEFIISEYKSYNTADKYVTGLEETIINLSSNAHIYQIQTEPFIVQQYGNYTRRVNYKKMAILYSIHQNTVYILRVIPQSTIISGFNKSF